MIGEIIVRNAVDGEVPPELMSGGMEHYAVDTDWQWVLECDGHIVAQMLTVNAHGILLILRLTSLPEAPHGWAVKMFRSVMAEAKARGLIGFTTFLSDTSKAEQKLMRIVQRLDGMLIPASGAWAIGSTEVRY